MKRVYEGTRAEQKRQAAATWKAKNPEKAKASSRNTKLKKAFNITHEDYLVLLANQGGVCAICKQEELSRHLAVDHCHTTGQVRGLLCTKCNNGLGNFNDSPELLQQAIGYLK